MKKILVIQNKRIGDVLIASLIAANIKQIFPNSQVDYFVYDYTTGVIIHNPNIDKIIPINEKELKKIPNLFKTTWLIRKENYDVIFDPYSKFQSKFITFFSNANVRVGYQKKDKISLFNFYTHKATPLEKKSLPCGKSIEERVHLVNSVFPLETPIYTPKLYLTATEKKYSKLDFYSKPVIMVGVLGSTPQKSMPYSYIVKLIDYVTSNFEVNILFNYGPYQKAEAIKIYEACKHKDAIIFDIYESNIRGFISLMNQCKLLIANEGGSVHIAKALDKPTFTIFSPYVLKSDWGSFEDGKQHTSVHLLDEKPGLFSISREKRKEIEKDPTVLYNQLTPEIILKKLIPFLKHHIK